MTSDAQRLTGRCLCRAVRYEVAGPIRWTAHCHCESCRRATSSAFASFFGVAVSGLRWTAAQPSWFSSSPGVHRAFCGTCGAPMAYRSDARADEIDLYAATLDAPETYAPDMQVFCDERMPWACPDAAPNTFPGSADG